MNSFIMLTVVYKSLCRLQNEANLVIEMIQAVMFMYETIVNNGWQQQEQSCDKWRFSNQQTCVGWGTLNYSEKKINCSIYMYVCVPIIWVG